MKIRSALAVATLTCLLGTAVSHAASAAENWENHCQKCHGADGKGKTPAGKKLKLKDYTSAEVQAAMDDAKITHEIADGITEGGKEKMKPYKDVLTPEEIKDLVAHIRKFKA